MPILREILVIPIGIRATTRRRGLFALIVKCFGIQWKNTLNCIAILLDTSLRASPMPMPMQIKYLLI